MDELKLSSGMLEWLLEGEPFVVYRTRRDLLGEQENGDEVKHARAKMLGDSRVQNIINDLRNWPWQVISSHKSAGQPFHKLTFLADLGVRSDDPGLAEILERILESQSEEGAFQLPINESVRSGRTGEEGWGWALCDAPLMLYALGKMGLQSHPAVERSAVFLAGLVRENGWPCAVSKSLGNFRGPGRRQDSCPFATLAMLKAFAEFDEWKDSPACRYGTESLLKLWANSIIEHPYMFYMGTDFRKLKVPFIWYDLLHVMEVLSRFPWVRGDPRYLEMISLLQGKADGDGRFTLESVWQAWKDWEFGQKKVPSRWLTLLALRVRLR